MGIGSYNDESIHDQKTVNFLPIFCRLSIKDVKLNTVPISAAAAAAADPSSPRVSCMGQVKRNNRVTASPTTITAAAAAHHHHKHTKPRKIQYFSTKTLLPNPATTAKAAAAPPATRSRSCRSNRDSRRSASRIIYDQDCHKVAVDISKMDPPLPVVKRAAPPPGNSRDEVNLWKRRFDGAKKRMQIEPINLPGKRFQPPPTTV